MRVAIGLITGYAVVALLGRAPATAQLVPPGFSPEGIKTATTPESHRAIAEAYAREAEELRARVLAHRKMEGSYDESRYLSGKAAFARHCRALTQAYETAAKEAEALEMGHHAMADAAARQAQ